MRPTGPEPIGFDHMFLENLHGKANEVKSDSSDRMYTTNLVSYGFVTVSYCSEMLAQQRGLPYKDTSNDG